MSLRLKEVRVPTPRIRGEKILAALLAGGDLVEYLVAGAISPNDGVAILRPSAAAMAMTIADGTISGETMRIEMLDQKDPTFTAVVTPANLTGATTITFAAIGEFAIIIWDEVAGAWQVRPGETATVA